MPEIPCTPPLPSIARHTRASYWSRCSPSLHLESIKYQIPSASFSIEKQWTPSHGTPPSGTSPMLAALRHQCLLPHPGHPQRSPGRDPRLKGRCYQLHAGAAAVACPRHKPCLLWLPQPCQTKPPQGWEVEVPAPVSGFPLLHRTGPSGLFKTQPVAFIYPVWSNHTKSRDCCKY